MKKVTDYFKKAPGKYFLVIFLMTLWIYLGNLLGHTLSMEVNGGLQAVATFVFIVYSYYTFYFSIKLLNLKS
jgi:hypothetical protein